MDLHDIQSVLRRISYKPGWTFEAYEDPFEGHKLRITAVGLQDSYDPDRGIDLGVDTFVPPMEGPEQLKRFVFWRVKRIEIHEAMEFFRIDGKVVWDPHA